jgi:DNA-binding transcriptional LysR family regulator
MHKSLSWDDARILLAVIRQGTQAAASKVLGIDQATVSRRLLRLEDIMGTPLFLRDGTRLIPTDAARRMADYAEEAESALASAFTSDEATEAIGVVRVTAVPMIAAHVLAPALRLLHDLAPGVVVELIGTSRI